MAAINTKSFYRKDSGTRPSRWKVDQTLQQIGGDDSDIDMLSDNEDNDITYQNRDVEEGDSTDGDGSSNSEDEQEEGRGGRNEMWLHSANFDPTVVAFQPTLLDYEDRSDWLPLNYFSQYIDSDFVKIMSDCTNISSVANTGRSFNTTVTEVFNFLGASLFMSCIGYPRVKMYWSRALKIPAVCDTISRDRFFKIRTNLKVVVDSDVSIEQRQRDKFWKVRPLIERVRQGCLKLPRTSDVNIDEQMIPFTGACPFRQYIPSKPNPVGLKNFVLATSDGMMLDFELYQGADVFRTWMMSVILVWEVWWLLISHVLCNQVQRYTVTDILHR